jgi:Domain of unknown function (DUF3883)
MSRKLLLKRLTASDLTLFKYHFQNRPAGKQKAVNMDAAVFVRQLYPSLPEAVLTLPGRRVPLDISMYGPGTAPVHNLQRKILKQEKNWRLNGEYIDGPDDAPNRYNELREGDFAVFEFTGFPYPTSAKIALISRSNAKDGELHRELEKRFGLTSMVALTPALLEEIIESATPPKDHPIHEWAGADLIEEAALGNALGIDRLLKRRQGRGLSQEELLIARSSGERTGQLGEELVDVYFKGQKDAGNVTAYDWVSQANAIAPYDFRVEWKGRRPTLLDVKSTRGGFENPIHVSLGELVRSQQGPELYEIYRLYEVTERSAKLRVSIGVAKSFKPILEAVADLPKGVCADGFSIAVGVLRFDKEIEINLDE